MSDKVAGFLEVGLNYDNDIVINHPDLKPDENGVGHIVFSPNQARHLAALLNKHANKVDPYNQRAGGPDHYCVLVRADGTEVERWEVSNTMPRTIGWNVGLEVGQHGLGKDVSRAITEDKLP